MNVDTNPEVKADVYMDAIEFVRQYSDQVEEVYMGHFLEHILPGDALSLLGMLCERLPKGAVVSAVTPDMDQVWQGYRNGEIDNNFLNSWYVYSYVQPSHHVWCYDQQSLLELFQQAGFDDAAPLDPYAWEPVQVKEGDFSQWQCGVKATALGAPRSRLGAPPDVVRLKWSEVFGEDAESAEELPRTPQELMLRRIQTLRQELAVEGGRQRRPEPRSSRTPTSKVEQRRVGQPPATDAGTSGRPARMGSRGRRAQIRAVAKKRLPAGSRRRQVATAMLATYREGVHFRQAVHRAWQKPGLLEGRTPSYPEWLRSHRPTAADLAAQAEQATRTHAARVHVVVLPGSGSLAKTVRSLIAQSWPRWTASICTGGDAGLWPDKRITAGPDAGSPVAAANQAVVGADSDFVILLRAGDLLAPDCAYHVASSAHQDSLVDLVTWDDDLIGPGDQPTDPRFRAQRWSPEVLLSANHLDHAFAMRRRRYIVAGGLNEKYGDAAVWELLLRAELTEERVAHVSRVLSSVTDRPGAVDDDGVRAVQEQIDRLGWPARAVADRDVVRLRWELPEPRPHVTVVIPTRHNRKMLSTVLPSLARTDYPSFDVIVVDNGDRTDQNEQWYTDHHHGLDLDVMWWDRDFNYSAVNNVAAARARGDVLVFLNDDTEILDPGWMTELVGWATRKDIGVAGLQLVGPDDRLQHAGVVLGMGGFADHVFEGMRPGEDSIFGSTRWYRNTLAVTGACLAIRRELFESVGGFDERFVLCGSDVVLGLDSVSRGYRNVCSPFTRVRHLESATRGSSVPRRDYFASYWRYNTWLFGGDPYFSPNLSLTSRRPALRPSTEPSTAERIGVTLDRRFEAYRQTSDEAEARMLAEQCRALPVDTAATMELHAQNAEPFRIETVNWFIPGVDSPFYGGINTALRIADELARDHKVRNRFVVFAEPNEMFIRSALAAAMPALADSEIVFYSLDSPASLDAVPYADVSIATLWTTAYSVAHFQHTRRKFYLIQDFEPGFYPAGTVYALAEESYRLGLYGLCNTENLLNIYRNNYGGAGYAFTPAVDQDIFHARWRHGRMPDAPVTVFVYARPGHWRNCWEMAAPALEELKARLGDRVRIVAAGSWADGHGAEMEVKRLGLLDYRATGELYRHCDVGIALTVSQHPSYLPLELMACGVPVVAFDNPAGHWILRDGQNSLLAKRTVDGLVDCLERLCVDNELRKRLAAQALADIADRHSDWDAALAGIYPYLCDPEGRGPDSTWGVDR